MSLNATELNLYAVPGGPTQQSYIFDACQPTGQAMNEITIWPLLQQNPHLEYKVENDQVYVISDGADLSLIVPKSRSVPESYEVITKNQLTLAYRYLGWACLTLPLAGLGTFIFALLAIWQANRAAINQPLSPGDQNRAGIAIVLASALLVAASVLFGLFVSHF